MTACPCQPRRAPTPVESASRPTQNRNPHRPQPGARGFVPRGLSYASRRPKLFTGAEGRLWNAYGSDYTQSISYRHIEALIRECGQGQSLRASRTHFVDEADVGESVGSAPKFVNYPYSAARPTESRHSSISKSLSRCDSQSRVHAAPTPPWCSSCLSQDARWAQQRSRKTWSRRTKRQCPSSGLAGASRRSPKGVGATTMRMTKVGAELPSVSDVPKVAQGSMGDTRRTQSGGRRPVQPTSS